ncbi:hypothetical protein C8Q74DRAFT_12654 [Fomes fomentarius]|nr:hypothetical protein C8Q74DRAFT_12654 [Fomes fomentarius]
MGVRFACNHRHRAASAQLRPLMRFSRFQVNDGGLAGEDETPPNSLDVQEWARSRMKEYADRIHALRRAYNAAAPINRVLPVEIRMEIFQLLPTLSRDSGGDWRAFVLLEVCQLWRETLFNTPVFWVKEVGYLRAMDSKGAVDRIREFLRLTATLPLTLRLKVVPSRALPALTPYLDRITVLDIRLSQGGIQAGGAWLNGGIPALVRLIITHREEDRAFMNSRRSLSPALSFPVCSGSSVRQRLGISGSTLLTTVYNIYISLIALAWYARQLGLTHQTCSRYWSAAPLWRLCGSSRFLSQSPLCSIQTIAFYPASVGSS